MIIYTIKYSLYLGLLTARSDFFIEKLNISRRVADKNRPRTVFYFKFAIEKGSMDDVFWGTTTVWRQICWTGGKKIIILVQIPSSHAAAAMHWARLARTRLLTPAPNEKFGGNFGTRAAVRDMPLGYSCIDDVIDWLTNIHAIAYICGPVSRLCTVQRFFDRCGLVFLCRSVIEWAKINVW